MKITPTLEECKKIAAEESYGVIPISTEMYRSVAHLKKGQRSCLSAGKRGGG